MTNPDGTEPPPYVPPGYTPPGYIPSQPYADSPYPLSGFAVPAGATPLGYGPMDPRVYDTDPLVAGPVEPFRGWWLRVWATLGRSWRPLAPIVLLLFAAPQLAISLFQGAIGMNTDSATDPVASVGALALGSVVLTIVAFYLCAIGWGASHWTIVRQAVGAPAPFGEALVFGFRSSLRVWGWMLLYALIVGLGFCAIFVPGIYLAIAGGLIVPATLFQRGTSAISTSFGMVNRNFAAAAGRLILSYVPKVIVILVVAAVSLGQFSLAAASPVLRSTPDLAGSFVGAILGVPAQMIVIIGVLLTYGQLRAKLYPSTSMDLAAAL